MKSNTSFFASAILFVAFLSLGGCGSSPGDQGPDPKVEQSRLDSAKEMRAIYDRVGGDWNKLGEADKKKYTELAGGDANAQKAWTALQGAATGRPPGSTTAPPGSGG